MTAFPSNSDGDVADMIYSSGAMHGICSGLQSSVAAVYRRRFGLHCFYCRRFLGGVA